MRPDIRIYGFETSNNMKVRVALGYKQIPYAFHRIDPAERSRVVELSGQSLTPVMLHGDTVLFDSAAIMRYLDANFRETPPLYGRSPLEAWAVEDQELFARTVLAGPVMDVVHHEVATGGVDEERRSRAAAAMTRAVDQLAARLEGRSWLVGESMSAADVTAACVIRRVETGRLFAMPAAAQRLTTWLPAVLRHDRFYEGP